MHLPLYVINVATGGLERVTDLLALQGIAWSPDSRQLAFASGCEDPNRKSEPGTDGSFSAALYVADVVTRKLRRLTGFTRYFWPSWSPDGRRIAFLHEQEIRVIDAVRRGGSDAVSGWG